MNDSKKLGKLYAVIVTLVIVIIFLMGYIVVSYIAKDKILNEAENNTEILQDNDGAVNNKENVEDAKPNEDNENVEAIVNDLYSYYDMNSYSDPDTEIRSIELDGTGLSYSHFLNAYSNKKVLVEDLISDKDKITIASYWISSDKMTVSSDGYKITTKFLVSDLKDSYLKFFGNIENVIFNAFENYNYGKCNIDGDYYVCENGPGGGIGSPYDLLTKYKGYEYTEDEIYIYEYAIFSFDGTSYATSKNLNTYGEFVNEIPELKGLTPEKVFSSSHDDKLLVYKHTFRQNANGAYYWYSTEPVK